MPTFDALFVSSFVVDVLICLIPVLQQNEDLHKKPNRARRMLILRKIVVFFAIWIAVAVFSIYLCLHFNWESDIFNKSLPNSSLAETVISDNEIDYATPLLSPSPTSTFSLSEMNDNNFPYIYISDIEYPLLRVGESSDIYVTVTYMCPENADCVLTVGFNNEENMVCSLQDLQYITSDKGVYTFKTNVTPVIWSDGTPFMIYVNLAYWPLPTEGYWEPIGADDMILQVFP